MHHGKPKPRSLAYLRDAITRTKRAWPHSRRLVVLLKAAAELDDADAADYLGMYYRDGLRDRRGRTILRRSALTSLRYYRRGARLGNSDAMIGLGNALASGRKSRRLVAEGMAWYLKAYRRGNVLGASCLAAVYRDLGMHAKAVAWFRRGAKAGDDDDLLELACAQLYGLGTRRNVAAAMRNLRRVARPSAYATQFSQETAMIMMARVLEEGWLARRNHKRACVWLRRAEKLGSRAAGGFLEDLDEPRG